MADVRSRTGVPTVSDFTNTDGTPVVVDRTTGSAYVLRADNSVAVIGGTASGPVTGLTMTTNRVLGRTSAGTGAVEELVVGGGLSLSAGTLTATGGSGGPVTAFTMNTNRMLGRTTAGTGAVEEIIVGAGLSLSAGTLSATATAATLPTSTQTGAFTLGAAQLGRVVTCSGTFTVSITAAATLGDGWWCWLVNIGTGTITLDPNASELIFGPGLAQAGQTTVTLPYSGAVEGPYNVAGVLLQCNGTGFRIVSTNETHGEVVYTSGSGAFTVPAGVTTLWVDACGGGGAGGSTATGSNAGGGGGAGSALVASRISVAPGLVCNFTIGAGGAGAGSGINTNGGAGGATTCLALFSTLNGGAGGLGGPSGTGGAGGTGGLIGANGGDGNGSTLMSGEGGSSPFGGGGSTANGAGAGALGKAGRGYGAGGSGGSNGGNGGAGSGGFLRIRW